MVFPSPECDPHWSPSSRHCSNGYTQSKWPRFWQALSQCCTLAGAEVVWPARRTQQAHTISARENSWPRSHGERPRAEFSDLSTAARSLLPPSASWKTAVSIQQSISVAATGSWGSAPKRRKRKRAMLASPSIGHMLCVLNFICSFDTEKKKNIQLACRNIRGNIHFFFFPERETASFLKCYFLLLLIIWTISISFIFLIHTFIKLCIIHQCTLQRKKVCICNSLKYNSLLRL